MARYGKDLINLYEELMNGAEYGYLGDVLNSAAFPGCKKYFAEVLYMYRSNLDGKQYFQWRYFGSSANKATKKDLSWILENIFNMTAKQFVAYYITRDEAKTLPKVSA